LLGSPDYWLVAGLGALFGFTELLSRYRDEPLRAVTSMPGLFYIAINAGVSVAALHLTEVFGWKFGLTESDSVLKLSAVRILVAGLGSMTLLRSTLFTIRIGNQDVGIGFSAMVQSLLRVTDAAVDRGRGVARSRAVAIMERVSFAKAFQSLPSLCLGLMQNVSKEDQTALSRQIEAIAKMKADDVVKSRLLGLAIIDFMGERVLFAAMDDIGRHILKDEVPAPLIEKNLRVKDSAKQ
jgi:hypothetical protein